MVGKPRILFVDDEELLMEAMRRAFLRHRRKDWDMTFETDPQQAIKLQAKQPFEVVVTDYHMPEFTGIEVAKQIHEIDHTTQIMMLTGAADLDTAANVINSTEIYRFYTKPCPPEILEAGIVDCLRRYQQKKEENKGTPQYGRNVLDRLPIAIFICERNGHVVHMNQSGADICAAHDLLTIDQANTLRSVQTSYREELIAAIAADDECDRAMSLLRPDSEKTISLIVSNFHDELNDKVMVLVSDPQMHIAPSTDILQSIYGLPLSEAKLLQYLVQGYSLKEAAEMIEVAESSARTYLKRIFSKTNTSGQLELIRTVLLTPSLQ